MITLNGKEGYGRLLTGSVVRSAPEIFYRPKGIKTFLGAAPPDATREESLASVSISA